MTFFYWFVSTFAVSLVIYELSKINDNLQASVSNSEHIGVSLGELVHLLESVTLTEEMETGLRVRAARKLHSDFPVEEVDTYQKGLIDGETMTAQYVLGESSEETANV